MDAHFKKPICNIRNAKSAGKREREGETERAYFTHIISQKIYYIHKQKHNGLRTPNKNVIYIQKKSKEVLLELPSWGLFKILTDTQKGKVPERENTRFMMGRE